LGFSFANFLNAFLKSFPCRFPTTHRPNCRAGRFLPGSANRTRRRRAGSCRGWRSVRPRPVCLVQEVAREARETRPRRRSLPFSSVLSPAFARPIRPSARSTEQRRACFLALEGLEVRPRSSALLRP